MLRRTIRGVYRRYREARMFAKAMHSPRHPIVAHIIPIRRCNLSCAYCNEFDDYSQPVPTGEMLRRVDRLAALGTTIITISGGEPLLHPELEAIIRHIRRHGIIATLITNGYLLAPDRIKRLNRAGLDSLEISIDNVMPDEVSKKSLKVLDKKLQCLAKHAEFDVNVNSVIGTDVCNPEDALVIARRAVALGFTSTVGIVHDHAGQLVPLDARHQRIFDEVVRMGKPLFAFVRYDHFQENLLRGLPNDWHCHAGSRYLYICEDGLVHWCSQQRGYPGIPLEQYTEEHLKREYHTVKTCAPYCTISCVHQVSMLDSIREKPLEAISKLVGIRSEQGRPTPLPVPVRILTSLFLGPKKSRRRQIFTNAALWLLGAK